MLRFGSWVVEGDGGEGWSQERRSNAFLSFVVLEHLGEILYFFADPMVVGIVLVLFGEKFFQVPSAFRNEEVNDG